MKVRGFELDVNIMGELEPYLDSFYKWQEKGIKLIATSPFREETHPSFAVNLETGTYIDSGCTDDEWRKGNFVKLLSFFRGESYDDTEDYLLSVYRLFLDDVDALSLDFQLQNTVNKKIYPLEALRAFSFDVNYLDNRGIDPQVKKAFKAGYDPKSKAIVLPIQDKKGNIVSFKFRKVADKIFWYDKEGQPVKQHLYGLNFIHQMNCKKAYIVEGEIDALYLWSNRTPAIATFGASLSKRQKQLILSSPIETLVIATDNDRVGRAYADYLENTFLGTVHIERLDLPTVYKDVNEVPQDVVAEILANTIPSTLTLCRG